jgi:hypothetical protein
VRFVHSNFQCKNVIFGEITANLLITLGVSDSIVLHLPLFNWKIPLRNLKWLHPNVHHFRTDADDVMKTDLNVLNAFLPRYLIS